ncbi:MAG TPA: cyclopropane fatty acyl phospholipid synthase [Steroidobacteraceae bacterium]|nr:cyclopropane fatty acyl phospholipid synthase [Steroidobacteraceae bacterium]
MAKLDVASTLAPGAASTARPTERSTYEQALADLLAPADVVLNGTRPWDIQVHDDRMAHRILGHGTLGAGESYMDGWWDCAQLDEMLTRVLRSNVVERLHSPRGVRLALSARLFNMQNTRRAFKVGERHYDLGDDLYERMLDPRMIYSCAYWPSAQSLAAAQEAKLDLVARKLGLEPGMRVLDIGCGWGGAAQFMAQRYGVAVTGVTVSRNQAETARERCAGLDVEIRLEDYRSLTGKFDALYSLGMFEHVGVRNYRTYFGKARELLNRDGLFLLHTIGSNTSSVTTDPWIEKHIFPNSQLPSLAQIAAAAEGGWIIEDFHSFGPDYDRTLLAWSANFERTWPEIASRYGERFHRMWHFWLMASAAGFRARKNQLWQFVLSPSGVPGGYRVVR